MRILETLPGTAPAYDTRQLAEIPRAESPLDDYNPNAPAHHYAVILPSGMRHHFWTEEEARASQYWNAPEPTTNKAQATR